MTFGVCKLTGYKGTYVKCHLLPKALTSPPNRGEVRVEGGEGLRPVARFDSWYDKTIVTRKGEDIFERLDTFAISELRRHKLIWSSWADRDRICPIESDKIDEQWGIRRTEFSDPERMRLFFLSLLWRAAVTNVRGFANISLSPQRLQLITDMLLSNHARPLEHFPVHLVQLITRGGWHNQSPIRQLNPFLDVDGSQREIGTFRFYMDGLVIHIEDEIDDAVHWRHPGAAVGESPVQIILTMPFEQSFQEELINRHMLGTLNNESHAAIVERIFDHRKPRAD